MKKKYGYRKLAGFGLVGCMIGCLLLGGTMATQEVHAQEGTSVVTQTSYVSQRAKDAMMKALAEISERQAYTGDQIRYEDTAQSLDADRQEGTKRIIAAFDKLPENLRKFVTYMSFYQKQDGYYGLTASLSGKTWLNTQYYNLNAFDQSYGTLYHEMSHSIDGKTFYTTNGVEYSLSRDAQIVPLLKGIDPNAPVYETWANLFASYVMSRMHYQETAPTKDEKAMHYFDELLGEALFGSKAYANEVHEDIVEEPKVDAENTSEENAVEETTIEKDAVEEDAIENDAVEEDVVDDAVEESVVEEPKAEAVEEPKAEAVEGAEDVVEEPKAEAVEESKEAVAEEGAVEDAVEKDAVEEGAVEDAVEEGVIEASKVDAETQVDKVDAETQSEGTQDAEIQAEEGAIEEPKAESTQAEGAQDAEPKAEETVEEPKVDAETQAVETVEEPKEDVVEVSKLDTETQDEEVIEEPKVVEPKAETQSEGTKDAETQSEENAVEETQSESTQSESTQSESTQSEENAVEETQSESTQSEETQSEETQSEGAETQSEGTQKDEPKLVKESKSDKPTTKAELPKTGDSAIWAPIVGFTFLGMTVGTLYVKRKKNVN